MRLYSVLDTVVISGEDVCCSAMFVFSVMWSELLMTWISVVNVYHDHLKFFSVCINGRRYVCCTEYCSVMLM